MLQHHQEEALKEVEEILFNIIDMNNINKTIVKQIVACAREVMIMFIMITDMSN